MKSPTRELYATVTNGLDVIAHDDDLKSVKVSTSSGLLRSVMRQCEIKYLGSHAMLGDTVQLEIGCSIPTYVDDLTKPIYEEDGETISGYYQKIDSYTDESIDYGSFIITSEETNQVTGETTAKGFDLMYLANEQYSLTPTYPIDLMDLVTAICTELGWTLNATSFPNDDLVIASELFSESKLTYRQILDQVAEASGSTIYFSGDDELHFRQVEVSSLDETLGLADMFSIKLEPKYTDINQLVASRMPQEDNILVKDDANIALNGIKELRIVNNLIIDSDRETYLPTIFAELLGLNFYPCEAKTVGLGYFEIGDRISVPNGAGTGHETVVMEYEVVMDGSLRETLKCLSPDKTYTNLNYAGVIGQIIKDTQIIVNKQTGEIEIITQDISGLASIVVAIGEITQTVADLEALTETQQTQITELQQTVDALELSVQGLGGTNLLRNSVGLKGEIGEWQDLDENGDPVDVRNSGTIINDTDLKINSESGSGIQLNNQFIKQQFPTILNETYTIYLRYKSTDDATVTVTGHDSITIPESADWGIFKHSFLTNSVSTTIQFENTTGDTITLTDVVVKLGDVNGWTQAPNELYGTNFRFDREGFSITSLTDTFRSVLDNTKLAVYDTAGDKVVLLVSKDSGIITKLIAQTELTIQRYEDADKSLRFIPVDTGALVVIND